MSGEKWLTRWVSAEDAAALYRNLSKKVTFHRTAQGQGSRIVKIVVPEPAVETRVEGAAVRLQDGTLLRSRETGQVIIGKAEWTGTNPVAPAKSRWVKATIVTEDK